MKPYSGDRGSLLPSSHVAENASNWLALDRQGTLVTTIKWAADADDAKVSLGIIPYAAAAAAASSMITLDGNTA